MSGPSLEYYASIFRNNPERISSVKDLLIKDFRSFESKFQQGVNNNDFLLLKKELHKIRPIVSNLRYSKMEGLIERYESLNYPSQEVDALNQELSECLSRIFHFLQTH